MGLRFPSTSHFPGEHEVNMLWKQVARRLLWHSTERWGPDHFFVGVAALLGGWLWIKEGWLAGAGGVILVLILRELLYHLLVRRRENR